MASSVFKVQRAANGSTGIFWEKELRKDNRKFGYKTRDQRYTVRKDPNNLDKYPPEEERLFKPLDEEEAQRKEEAKKPAIDFIKRNRDRAKRGKKAAAIDAKTVTLTQEQLNAILASVGKVAGGEEKELRISFDDEKHQVKIESPRRHEDDYEDDRSEREERKPSRRREKDRREEKKEEEGSIFSLMSNQNTRPQDSDEGSVGSDREEKLIKPKRRGSLESEDDKKIRKSKSKRDRRGKDDDRHRKERSRRRDDSEEDRERSKRRDESNDRHRKERSRRRDDSNERRRRDDSVERRRRDNSVEERKGRSKRHDYSRDNSEKLTDRSRRKRDRSRESRDIEEKENRTHDKKDLNESGGDHSPGKDLITPRDVLGLPPELSWKHMTKAERRRLMLTRQKMAALEEKKEEERVHDLYSKYGLDTLTDKPSKESRKRSPPPSQDSHRTSNESRLVSRTTKHTKSTPDRRRSPSPVEEEMDGEPKPLPIPKAHMTLAQKKRLEWERERVEAGEPMNVIRHTEPETRPPPVPKAHMTLAQKKRLEWERDGVESKMYAQESRYDPWGRPGAGAPLRTNSGKVLADYRNRQVHSRKGSSDGKQYFFM